MGDEQSDQRARLAKIVREQREREARDAELDRLHQEAFDKRRAEDAQRRRGEFVT